MIAKLVAGLSGILAVLALGLLAVHVTRTKVMVEGPAADAPRRPLDEVDHASLDLLLRKYVDDQGLVAYRRWKEDSADLKALDSYLAAMGSVEVLRPATPAARLAFWINLYNALTIRGILKEYPTSSIRNHTPLLGGYNLWTDLLVDIAGRHYSLDDIEHGTLRTLGEPRIHFALVCAARGCPPLRNRAYTPANLDEALTDNARRFFARPENFRADPARRTVWLSELLDWYGSDFAPTPAEQLKVIRPFLPAAESLSWIEEPGVAVRYLEYDWSLNDQTPVGR